MMHTVFVKRVISMFYVEGKLKILNREIPIKLDLLKNDVIISDSIDRNIVPEIILANTPSIGIFEGKSKSMHVKVFGTWVIENDLSFFDCVEKVSFRAIDHPMIKITKID